MSEGVEKHNILIVDDLVSNIKTLAETLRKEHNIFVATSGKDALALVDNESIDLILLDIVMPEMDGYEVCKSLKKTDVGKKIPVIFVTVLSESLDEVRALDAGAVDFITKPVHAPSVRAKVANHLAMVDMLKTIEKQNIQILEVAHAKEEMNHITQTDLRKPLERIVSLTNQLTWTTNPTDEQINLLQGLLKHTYRLSNLLNSSIELYNIRNNRYRFTPKSFDFLTLVDDFLMIEKEQIEEHKAIVRIQVHGSPRMSRDTFKVIGDVTLGYSIVSSIILNAITQSASGGVVSLFFETIHSGGKNNSIIKIHSEGRAFVEKDQVSLAVPLEGRRKGFELYAVKLMTEVQKGTLQYDFAEDFGSTITLSFPSVDSYNVK
ncbi:MAG: response regulator [Magnetococcales bacterium]|nr:response regulator [Magnetococcales bacterium]